MKKALPIVTLLVLSIGCAHLEAINPKLRTDWNSTLSYARQDVDSGNYFAAEKLLDDDKLGPRWAQLQSLNMLCCTEGKERTLSEYEQLLRSAGFTGEVLGCRTPSPLDAVLALKT